MGEQRPNVIPIRSGKPNRISDEALLAACGMADEAALEELFERHQLLVHRFLHRMLPRSPNVVEDLVQSTFLEVWRCAPRFRGRSAGRTFIVGIACNLARMNRRGEARRQRALDTLTHRPQKATATPEDQALRGQRVAALEEAITGLSPKLRAAFVLCDMEGMSGAEAAASLGIRTSSVWRRLHDARKKLRAAIGEDLR